ncbi:MAG: hypothetical protein GTO17_10625 [Candidatus Aminicenantes bacterium]|nr:hypothetical protein [Candidatus Aminicenantes bacterium]
MDIPLTESRIQKLLNNRWFFIFLVVIAGYFLGNFFFGLTLYKQYLWLFLGIFFIIVFAIGTPILLLLLLLLSIFSRGVFNIMGDITLFDISLIILSGSIIIRKISIKKSFKFRKEGKVFVVFMSIIIFSEALGFIRFPGIFISASFKPFLQLIEYLLVFMCAVYLIRTPKDIKKYVGFEVFCGLLLAVVTLYEANFGIFTFRDQPIFLNTYYPFLGELKINPSLMLLFIPTFWLVVFLARKKLYLFGLIPFLVYIFILSASRSLYLGILGGVIGLLYLKNISRVALVLIICIVVGAFNISFVKPKVSEVYESFEGYFSDPYTFPYSIKKTSTAGRFVLIKTALLLTLRHPFWGYGINGFGMELYSRSDLKDSSGNNVFLDWFGTPLTPFSDTHNQYLQILADHGILALVIFFYLIIKMLKISLNNYKKANDRFLKDVSRALFISLVSLLFAFLGVVLLETDNNITPMIFWFNLGLIYSIKRLVINNKGKNNNRMNHDFLKERENEKV